MSKQTRRGSGRRRPASGSTATRGRRDREAGIKAAAKATEKERQERRRAQGRAAKGAAVRSTTGRKRGHVPVGRQDGPLARRRRLRTRMLLGVLLALNVAVAAVWRDWRISLVLLIVSVVVTPMMLGLLLRRR